MSSELTIINDMVPHAAYARSGGNDYNRSVYVETYGCQMNVADSELVASILNEAGFNITEKAEGADVILLNTCAVREHAEERVIGRISQLNSLRNQRPHLTLGILGCMAQHLSDTLSERAPFVDIVMGPDSYRRLPDMLAQSSDEALLDVELDRSENYVGISPVRREGTNAWVTIIRGCDKFCTFCIVPFVRGRERSIDADEIVRQVEGVAQEGFREVTLLGQTVNSYRGDGCDFANLLRRVAAVEGIERLRFTSPYPIDFSDRVIEAMAEIKQVCPYMHLPVQSGSDAQLKAMKRGYTISEFRTLVSKLRSSIPNLALSTDVITGFCGESEEDFQQTFDMMQEIRFDSAFMFKYSAREGTYAHKRMPDDVPESVKGERLQRIIDLQKQISGEINGTYVGRQLPVLVEGPSRRPARDGTIRYYGRTPQNKTLIFSEAVPANTLVDIEVEHHTPHTLFGRCV